MAVGTAIATAWLNQNQQRDLWLGAIALVVTFFVIFVGRCFQAMHYIKATQAMQRVSIEGWRIANRDYMEGRPDGPVDAASLMQRFLRDLHEWRELEERTLRRVLTRHQMREYITEPPAPPPRPSPLPFPVVMQWPNALSAEHVQDLSILVSRLRLLDRYISER